jgi:transcriptional antiterminator RfaH
MEHWHLLHTKPHHERQVAVLLHQRGLEVYLPLFWPPRVNPRTARERPYFPRYLFARLDLQRIEMGILRWSPGLSGVLQFGHEPATVSDGFVSELQQRLKQVSVVGAMLFEGSQQTGLLEIQQGPFAGHEGLFNATLSGAARTRILLACVEREHCRLAVPSPRAPAAPGYGDEQSPAGHGLWQKLDGGAETGPS